MENLECRFHDWQNDVINHWGFNKEGNYTEQTQKNIGQFLWFRGASNYSYCLTTSFQRENIINEAKAKKYYNKIQGYINKIELDEIYNNKDNDGKFSLFGYEAFDLAFLQHRGFPSPLLDWTTDPMVAAQFACHKWIENEPQEPAVIYALNVKKLMELFNIEYKETSLICKDSVYNKETNEKNIFFEEVPPLRVGHNWSLLSKKTPIPFRGTLESLYLSSLWQQAVKPIIQNPLISRMYPQGGNFTFIPGEKSLEKWVESKGVNVDKVICKFKIHVDEQKQMKKILEGCPNGDAFGSTRITYNNLFPENRVSEINEKLEELREELDISTLLSDD